MLVLDAWLIPVEYVALAKTVMNKNVPNKLVKIKTFFHNIISYIPYIYDMI